MDTVNKKQFLYKINIVSYIYLLCIVATITNCTTHSTSNKATSFPKKEEKTIHTPLSIHKTNREALLEKYPSIIQYIADKYISLSDEEKIAQLLIIQAQNRDNNTLLQDIKNKQEFQVHFPYSIGGFILFKDNIVSIQQLQTFITQLKLYSKISPFISIDVEGGKVNRFNHLSHPLLSTIPSARELATSKTTTETREYMAHVGKILKNIGINMNFAPVADVEYPSTHPFLLSRIFSDNYTITANYAVAVATGLHDAGIISVLKHFPGHGSAQDDSHVTLPSIPVSIHTLKQKDLLPYMAQIPLGLDAIMIGHLSIPNLHSNFAPASKTVIEIARQHLGFTGLLITDSLRMNAIKQWNNPTNISTEEILLQTGIDILLDPQNYIQIIHTLTQRFRNDITFRDTIEKKVLKILQIKFKYNIL